MAHRCYFGINTSGSDHLFEEKLISFEFFTGFSIAQKQKSIRAMHTAIEQVEQNRLILEVSTKSENELGIRLSAFNLRLDYLGNRSTIEAAFQGSKVFRTGGPFRELLLTEPKTAKRDPRLKDSGLPVGFELDSGLFFPLSDRSDFYDLLYLRALVENPELLDEMAIYVFFTDIEFTKTRLGLQKGRPFNTQARSCAIAATLYRRGGLDAINAHIMHLMKRSSGPVSETLF